jgi:Spy/CpxP family protein refolding chaperone
MQNKNFVAALIVASALLLSSVTLFAQAAPQSVPGTGSQPKAASDQDIQMLREDIRSQRKQLTAANMTLTPDEATKFWPIYDQYVGELSKVGDARWALIKQYADTYNTMTDVQANDFIKRSGAIDRQFSELRLKYVPIFEKAVSPKKTALWYQIDRRLALLIDLQLASVIPVVDTNK